MSRKLDAAIAKALGYEVKPFNDNFVYYNAKKHGDDYVPRYSTGGNAMLELDREMQEKTFTLSVHGYTEGIRKVFRAVYYSADPGWNRYVAAIAESEPLARALAAYKALTGKEWTETVALAAEGCK